MKNNYVKFKKLQVCRVGTYPERWGKSNCEHHEGRLMMIDKQWLYLTPTHDYGVFMYPPVALSPSALFGLSEEACRRSAKRSWFLSSHSHQVNFSFPPLYIFILLNLLLVRKQRGLWVWTPIVANQEYSHVQALVVGACQTFMCQKKKPKKTLQIFK